MFFCTHPFPPTIIGRFNHVCCLKSHFFVGEIASSIRKFLGDIHMFNVWLVFLGQSTFSRWNQHVGRFLHHHVGWWNDPFPQFFLVYSPFLSANSPFSHLPTLFPPFSHLSQARLPFFGVSGVSGGLFPGQAQGHHLLGRGHLRGTLQVPCLQVWPKGIPSGNYYDGYG